MLKDWEPFKPSFIKEQGQLSKPENSDLANILLLQTVWSKDMWEFICIKLNMNSNCILGASKDFFCFVWIIFWVCFCFYDEQT